MKKFMSFKTVFVFLTALFVGGSAAHASPISLVEQNIADNEYKGMNAKQFVLKLTNDQPAETTFDCNINLTPGNPDGASFQKDYFVFQDQFFGSGITITKVNPDGSAIINLKHKVTAKQTISVPVTFLQDDDDFEACEEKFTLHIEGDGGRRAQLSCRQGVNRNLYHH